MVLCLSVTGLIRAEGHVTADTSQLFHEQKSVIRTYSVTGLKGLSVFNQYGDVTVQDWDKNEISADVRVDAYGLNPQQAKDLLGLIEIRDTTAAGRISLQTLVRKKEFPAIEYKGRGKSFRVTYLIHVPAGFALMVNNKMGKVNLESHSGSVSLECTYSEVMVDSLSKGSTIDMKFGSLKAKQLREMVLHAEMADLQIGRYDSSRGDLVYCGVEIRQASGSSALVVRHCPGVKILNTQGDRDSLDVKAYFSNLKLGSGGSLNINFMVKTNNGRFASEPSKTHFSDPAQEPGPDSNFNTHSYSGRYGRASGFRLNIESNFGDVTFL